MGRRAKSEDGVYFLTLLPLVAGIGIAGFETGGPQGALAAVVVAFVAMLVVGPIVFGGPSR